MKTAVVFCALAGAAFAQNSAMDILHRTAETYGKLDARQAKVTVQTIRENRVSEQSAVRPMAFDQIDRHVASARISREEQYMVDGQARPIVVVNVTHDDWPAGQFAMYRIDKQTYRVYKVNTYSKGSTEIALYSTPATHLTESASMVGMEAPDFTLPDTSGALVRLRDLRGKVVVVDFWATWCGPCRALMPHIQKMHAEWASKGLVVLGLDVGEDAAKVADFASKQSYTFRLLLNAEPDVTSRYFVEAYPTTFVIDRAGRIAFRDLGEPSPNALIAAVQAALASEDTSR